VLGGLGAALLFCVPGSIWFLIVTSCSGPISAPKAVDCRLEFAAHAADAGCVCSRAVVRTSDAGSD
jgi:hypothetical protein